LILKKIYLLEDLGLFLVLAKTFFQKSNLLIMKKLLFGLFLAISLGSFDSQAQCSMSLADDGSVPSVCCQSKGDFCQDRYGNAYLDSVKSNGPTCSRR
jgi:hypothetical protein